MKLGPRVPASLKRAQRQVFDVHGADLNFTGSAIGYRRRAGEVTDEPVVIAMVVSKRPEGSVSRWRLLPKSVEVGERKWGVDVVEVGPLTASGLSGVTQELEPGSVATPPTQQRVRPPLQGCSISNVNNGPIGTIGCIVTAYNLGIFYYLSTSAVLARFGKGTLSEGIIQPAAADGGTKADEIAALTEFIPMTTTGPNSVDAAIATLDVLIVPDSAVAGGLMPPISATHPAVGIVVADDSASCGTNTFLSRMDNTLASFTSITGLVPYTSDLTNPAVVVAPVVGKNIEKVGRSTGHTSSQIDAIGAVIKVNYGGTIITMSDMIWTQAFSHGGDSGAVACIGGNGRTFAPLPSHCTTPGPCALVSAIGTYYNLPLTTTANLTLADELRDKFLAMSNTGQLLIGLTYLNAQTVINRLDANTGASHNQSVARTRAQSLYTLYHDLVSTLVTSTNPTATVTASDVNAAASILYGLTAPASQGGTAMLTAAESAAAWTLYETVIKPAVGMDRQQLISYMNRSSVYQKVHAQLRTVPTIKLTGQAKAE